MWPTGTRAHSARGLWHFNGDYEVPKAPPYPCEGCGAALVLYRDPRRRGWVAQHGDNPEAVLHLPVPLLSPFNTEPARQEAGERIAAWTAQVHAYEAVTARDGSVLR